jgi:wobble nucleotide-excising tRNase
MITKITKLNHFGILHDFTWKTDLPEFKRFNLIYGWNRSGKTTISRSFSACERKSIAFKHYPENGEFELKTDDGLCVKNSDIGNSNLPIKVFNKDFIEDNISFEPSYPCNPIVFISEEDIDTKKKLESLKQENITLNKNLDTAHKNNTAKEEMKNSFLIGLGREIANVLFDKTYNKTKVENKIKSIGVDNFKDKIVSTKDIKKLQEVSRSEAKQKENVLLEYHISFSFNDENIRSFETIFSVLCGLLDKKVISETLERLKTDSDLNRWVKQGFDLYKRKQLKAKCLFCQKPLDTGFLDSLSKHFSKDYEDLQIRITTFIDEIKKLKKEHIETQNNNLYPDLKNNYQEQGRTLNNVIDELNKWINDSVEKLHEKYNNPLFIIGFPDKPKDFVTSYNDVIGKLNEIINAHNEKVNNHPQEVKTARDKLELNAIAVALNKQDYKTIEEELSEAQDEEIEAKKALNLNIDKIKILEQKTSNIGKAIGEINKHLEEFFGRKEIQLELDGGNKGYTIKRDGKPANNLSEGEKTAIAFSYFIVKIKEKDFKIKDGIIFIDDPVSSFDSNFIYHCYSLINNHFKDVGQLFVSTHNFELFNLIKEWFLRKNKNRSDDVCGFYMIENYVETNIRKARIKELDKTLREFKSEYHFLFYRLDTFAQNPNPEYVDFYTIGNIARRFIEIFTNFKIPTTGDLSSKIDALKIDTTKISKTQQGKVYRLIQEFSHGSDPTSTIEHKDKTESQEAVKILLNMIKASDPVHFQILKKYS